MWPEVFCRCSGLSESPLFVQYLESHSYSESSGEVLTLENVPGWPCWLCWFSFHPVCRRQMVTHASPATQQGILGPKTIVLVLWDGGWQAS